MLGETGTYRSIMLPIKKHSLPGSCPLWISTIVSIVTEMVRTSKEPMSSTEQNQMEYKFIEYNFPNEMDILIILKTKIKCYVFAPEANHTAISTPIKPILVLRN